MNSTETVVCAGCGRDFKQGERAIEIGRADLFCTSMCAVPVAFVDEALSLIPMSFV